MNKDSKLIFEKYQTSQTLVVNEAWYNDVRDWNWNALAEVGKVLDPTGLSSIPDLIRSVQDWGSSEDNMYNPGKMAMIIVNAYCCIPNLGLLAGGVGGIGWAALKGAAKKAATNPRAAVTISEKILKFLTQTPVIKTTVGSAINKVLTSLQKSGKIDVTAKDAIMHVFTTGKLDNVQHAINIQGDMLKAGSKRDIFKAGLKPEKGLGNAVFGDTISVPPFAKGINVPFAGAAKGALRAATDTADHIQSKRDQNNKAPSYPTFSKSKWEQANKGQKFPKQVGDTFLNGKSGQVMLVVEREDKTDTSLSTQDILPTPDKLDAEETASNNQAANQQKKTTTASSQSNRDEKTVQAELDAAIKSGDQAKASQLFDELSAVRKQTNSPNQPVDLLKKYPVAGDASSSEPGAPVVPGSDTYAKDYTGVSIVEFLEKSGKPSDMEARRKLAVEKGIVTKPGEYTGTAEQNTKLLNTLRGSASTAPVASSTPYTSKYMGTPKPATPKPATPKPTDLLPKTGVKGKEVSTHFVRVGPGSYRPAVQADLTSGQQLFIRNPNPALRTVYPYIKVQNAPVRRANL
jgi:hypothetical protein